MVLRGVTITHPDRVVFPEAGITKLDVARYYDAVADRMLSHIAQRPLMVVRCPQGVGPSCFHQKHWEHVPRGMRAVPIRESSSKQMYPIVERAEDLLQLVQLNALEFHTWGSHVPDVEDADRIIFDLDPGPGVAWEYVVSAAHTIRKMLEELDLTSFAKTSGGAGLHVVAPLRPTVPFDRAKAFAKAVSETLARLSPDRYVTTMSKSRRQGRIYVDYLRNGRGATCVAAWSLRARKNATVSVPVRWNELNALRGGADWDIQSAPKRAAALRVDPWKGYPDLSQTLPKS
jgi:bifunctional non-homologous end joining protein LigD